MGKAGEHDRASKSAGEDLPADAGDRPGALYCHAPRYREQLHRFGTSDGRHNFLVDERDDALTLIFL